MNKHFTRCIALILTVLITTAAAGSMQRKKILVLHSYHQGLEWTDNISGGIQSVMDPLDSRIDVYYDYLDAKRKTGETHSRKLRDIFRTKYANMKFEAVIAADNDALEFIQKYGGTLYPDTPVVFCGINSFNDEMIAGMNNITGVTETTDYRSTIELMLKLHPERSRIVVITDKTTVGEKIRSDLESVAQRFNDRIRFEYYQDFSLEEIEKKIASVENQCIVYLTALSRDRNNRFISYSEGIGTIKRIPGVPVYSSWDFYLGKGIIGGVITSGTLQGREAANMVLRILSGEKSGDIPVLTHTANRYMFDYKEMKKFGIKQSQLPENSLIINRPSNFYEKHRKLFQFLIPLILLTASTLLWYFISQRQKQNLLLQMNLKLDRIVREKTSELNEANEMLLKLLNTMPSPVFYKDAKGIYRDCNKAFADKIIGLPKKCIQGRSMKELQGKIPEPLAEVYASRDRELLKAPGTLNYDAKVKCADGSIREYHFSKATLEDAEGNVAGIVGVMLDITARKKAETELAESEERFRRLHEASSAGVAIHDRGIIIDANSALTKITGYSLEELKNMDGVLLAAPEYRDEIRKRIHSGEEMLNEVEGLRKNGSRYPLEVRGKEIPYHGFMLRVTELRDITEYKKATAERERLIQELRKTNEKLKQISVTDSLTGVKNRRYIIKAFKNEIKKSERYGTPLSIIMTDLDHFKKINDTYGHQFGDSVLKRVSDEIRMSMRETDMIGRYGGEEFLIILPSTDSNQGSLLAERIRKTIESLNWEHENLKITISGGLAEYNGESGDELLKIADDRLYISKSKGRNMISCE